MVMFIVIKKYHNNEKAIVGKSAYLHSICAVSKLTSSCFVSTSVVIFIINSCNV